MIRLLLGATAALTARDALRRALLTKFRRDVAALNRGDYGPLLAGYADDAVLHFNTAEHRWSGVHRGKPAIERFLQDYTNAGVTGELGDLWLAGPLWKLSLVARFDDWAHGPGGEERYRNSTCIVLRTRWGRIVEQADFYEDTGRILAFEERLRAAGIAPVGATPVPA